MRMSRGSRFDPLPDTTKPHRASGTSLAITFSKGHMGPIVPSKAPKVARD
jgi:hypothetical protein